MGNSQGDKFSNSLQEEPGGCLSQVVTKENRLIDSKNSFKNVDDLSGFISFSDREKKILKQVVKAYHMRIPAYYFSLIEKLNDSRDPIRLQCVPSVEEINEEIHETIDPLGEEKTSPVPYLVHRYPNRVLLIVTGQCFMYCRHCTRKRLWRNHNPEPTLKEIEKAVMYIKENTAIREVVVSGGDPLTLPTEKIDYILSLLAELKHLEVIRIGTRTPVVLPQRVDDDLCAVLEKYGNLWINVQFNHPKEITSQSVQSCRKIQKCAIPMSNQSVLLKGINDNAEVMKELCHKLQSIRVRPYYLYQCDPVVGTAHFRTQVFKGVEILEKMRGHTSGMCIPTFVIDGIDGKGKVPLSPNYLVSSSREGILLRNYENKLFFYHNPMERIQVSCDKKMKPLIKKIGIAFNLKKSKYCEEEEEYDEIETIEKLKEEIEKYGFKTILLEQNESFTENIHRERPDFVINIAEGKGNLRGRESQVPCILESLNIPYSGSDSIALGIALDKHLTNQILKSANVPVPLMFMVKKEKEIELLKDIFHQKESFIVKPRWEGSSKGIFSNSVVNNFKELEERINYLLSKYHQPALIEEFLEKDEITVGVCGNDSPRILGMMKISPQDVSGKTFLYSLENKRDWQVKIKYEPHTTIAPDIKDVIKKYALEAYRVLELKDMARIDFRVSRDNLPKIIDINPLPGLSPLYSDLPILYKLDGGNHSDLIKILLKEAFKRYGFKWPDIEEAKYSTN